MDDLQAAKASEQRGPQERPPITRPRGGFSGTTDRPLQELTIRDLIIELGKVEDAQAHRPVADRVNYSERSASRREKLIIAELHRRRSPETPAEPLLPAEDTAEASASPSGAG